MIDSETKKTDVDKTSSNELDTKIVLEESHHQVELQKALPPPLVHIASSVSIDGVQANLIHMNGPVSDLGPHPPPPPQLSEPQEVELAKEQPSSSSAEVMKDVSPHGRYVKFEERLGSGAYKDV